MSNNFVISLKTAVNRRNHIQSVFEEAGVNFSFFEAITPGYDFIKPFNLKIDRKSSLLKDTEIACFLSHLSLWEYAVEKNLDYITIFEDDVFLGHQSDFYLNSYSWIPADCHLIKLEAFKKYRPMKQNKCGVPNGRKLGILLEKHLGAAGYIISQDIAKDLIAYVKNQNRLPPLDYLLFDPFYINQLKNKYHIYQLQPALCIQEHKKADIENANMVHLASQIQTSLQDNKTTSQHLSKKLYNQDKSLLSKIKKELHKLFYRNKDTIEWK